MISILLDKFKNYFLNYSFIEKIAQGETYNTNLKLRRNLNKSLWVGKIHRTLPDRLEDFNSSGKPYIRTVDFRDLNDRALLGFRLAKLSGLNSLKVKKIPLSRILNFDVSSVEYKKIDEDIFLSEFKGQSLPSYLASNSYKTFKDSDIENKYEAIRSFVFNLWVGDYDNKDMDYLVDDNKNLISIDYHLLGPGFCDNSKLALGSWGEAFDIDNPKDTGWCIGDGQLLSYVRNNVNNFEIFAKIIEKINSLSKVQIKFVMRGLNFYNQGTKDNINDIVFDFLIERRLKLRQTIKDWIKADCPITDLPKDNGIK